MTDFHAQEFDISNVTLKELRDVVSIVEQEIDRLLRRLTPEMNQRKIDLSCYNGFLQNSIQIKTIDEMNKHYFGGKISLKTKRLEDDGWVEYEPLFPK